MVLALAVGVGRARSRVLPARTRRSASCVGFGLRLHDAGLSTDPRSLAGRFGGMVGGGPPSPRPSGATKPGPVAGPGRERYSEQMTPWSGGQTEPGPAYACALPTIGTCSISHLGAR